MEADRAAAKRRASFGRADRLRKETQQKTEQTKDEHRRTVERGKADQQRKAEAVKAVEQRNALARKQAEQRRMERRQDHLKKEFARKAEDSHIHDAHADRQRKAEAAKVAGQKQAEHDPQRRDAEAHVAQQQKRQHADQQTEHRRQTDRLRTEQKAQRSGFSNQNAAAFINHARHIRNIDIAERRELDALDTQRGSFKGRVTELVRGAKHFDRQEQGIVERHENERWQKHRDHEAKKNQIFWSAQTKRLSLVSDRHAMAKAHQSERQELKQAQERTKLHLIEARAQAMIRVNENKHQLQRENVRSTQAFGQAAGQSHELKR